MKKYQPNGKLTTKRANSRNGSKNKPFKIHDITGVTEVVKTHEKGSVTISFNGSICNPFAFDLVGDAFGNIRTI